MFTLTFSKRNMEHRKEQVWEWEEEDRGKDRTGTQKHSLEIRPPWGRGSGQPVYHGRVDQDIIQTHLRQKSVFPG